MDIEMYEVKQNIILANGNNDWFVLDSHRHPHLAIDYANRLVESGLCAKKDLGIVKITRKAVEW